jgi:hypothetical protein
VQHNESLILQNLIQQKHAMRMIKPIYLCVVLTLSVFVSCLQQQNNNDDKLPVDAIAAPLKKDWVTKFM